MHENKIIMHGARFTFLSFLMVMALAGFAIGLVSSVFYVFMALFKLLARDPSIDIFSFLKPFLSIVTVPINSVISGVIFYPIYRYFMKKYDFMEIKLWVKNDNTEGNEKANPPY